MRFASDSLTLGGDVAESTNFTGYATADNLLLVGPEVGTHTVTVEEGQARRRTGSS